MLLRVYHGAVGVFLNLIDTKTGRHRRGESRWPVAGLAAGGIDGSSRFLRLQQLPFWPSRRWV